MYRSFTDRVLGGVCGGLAPAIRLRPWMLRGIFALFTIVSLGVGAALYLALWWLLPQESLIDPTRGDTLLTAAALVIAAGMIGVWVGSLAGVVEGTDGQPLLWPLVALILSVVFLLRQVRG